MSAALELPTTRTALVTIARLTMRRLLRGRALWLGAVVAALPVVFEALVDKSNPLQAVDATFTIELLVLVVLQPLFVASSIGEEVEDRTTTYLWSRPLARWTILIGKLIALAPIASALLVASWALAVQLGADHLPTAQSAIGLAAGGLAAAAIVAAIATLVPKHGMALAIVYLGIDFVIGTIPWSLQILSATHQAKLVAGRGGDYDGALTPAIALTVIAAAWLAIGLARVRRLES